jgi:hypothetical protein
MATSPTTIEQAAAVLARIEADPYLRARLSPHRLAHYISDGRWVPYPHLAYVGERITRAIVAGNSRVIINMPPRTGKSVLLTEWVPVWFLENFPGRRVICATHNTDLANRAGGNVRNIFDDPRLRTRISQHSSAKNQWETDKGGGMKCVGVGAGTIGFGADLFLVDDPYGSWADAHSAAYRRHLQDWFEATAKTRLEPNATIIVLNHRMAANDLTAYLLEQGGWNHISLPAIAGASDPMGRATGEPINPERFPLDKLIEKRDSTPGHIWLAMYQQDPQQTGSGACYRNFHGANIDANVSIVNGHPVQVALDYNINPGMHAIVGQAFGTEDRLTSVYEAHAPRMTIDACLADVKRYLDSIGYKGQWEIFADPAGTSSNAETGRSHHNTVRRWLNDRSIGYTWRVRAKTIPIIDRVNSVNDALKGSDGLPHYFIHPRCERLIEDYRQITADADGKPEKTDEGLSHASDADGYRIYSVRPIRAKFEVPRGVFGV